MALSSIQAALDLAVTAGVFPGAVLAVRNGDEAPVILVAGRLSTHPNDGAVAPTTIYDLASLTKPLATVTAVALLVQEGRCTLDDPVQRFVPALRNVPLGAARLRDLLTHSAGLPGWRSYYERLAPVADVPSTPAARAEAARRVVTLLKSEDVIYPLGERSLYSDLGFMLLGFLVERIAGASLDRVVAERIAQPLGVTRLAYRPAGATDAGWNVHEIAPTEFDPWRRRLLRGEVHDENAAALGGVAGHAGLFGAAESVLAVTGAWVRAWRREPSLLTYDVAREFTRRQDVPGSSWALGWDTPSAPSTSGRYFSLSSFGHLGYTGTSVWIDPQCGLEVVLLSNRVHPTRKNEAIKEFRPALHDVVYETVVRRG
jgi:serine-type D-Ala-D-Ala carboxypeptidase